ncbi:gluconate 2-dehydrogenase subunit 3 family protein [Flavihumibacter profundi]|uniref:gluconate 2-dehydrogenase subunit 3 family protein n=1 Tax=Flavihumibacter profundi TaxID=2716883 RepID=UPI001CC66B87|nr:gluconate 2-dehydrogenase subunit 3 family protein [Flavihumibacter profundi]MBZ5856987.1 gluconate 2-dehydrogenase subunit 3 family protein [Flavihumibacter profundi]
MDRRKSIKAMFIGTVSTSLIIEACRQSETPKTAKPETAAAVVDMKDRMAEELEHDKALHEEVFFTPAEMTTITVLADIIIPKDEVSGSASDAKVADFIEFMVKDKPELQVPMRGGLRWLDLHSLKYYEKSFTALDEKQQLEIVDEIAYPLKTKAEFKQGAAFFTLMRNLTISGFYTTEIGVKDIGYMGNKPNQWNGVPDEVLKQYNLAYTEKELKECISFDKA